MSVPVLQVVSRRLNCSRGLGPRRDSIALGLLIRALFPSHDEPASIYLVVIFAEHAKSERANEKKPCEDAAPHGLLHWLVSLAGINRPRRPVKLATIISRCRRKWTMRSDRL